MLFILFRGGDFLSVFNKDQLDALGMLFVRLHGQGNVINEIFWGLWLVPLRRPGVSSRASFLASSACG